jgi:hypothetical protein
MPNMIGANKRDMVEYCILGGIVLCGLLVGLNKYGARSNTILYVVILSFTLCYYVNATSFESASHYTPNQLVMAEDQFTNTDANSANAVSAATAHPMFEVPPINTLEQEVVMNMAPLARGSGDVWNDQNDQYAHDDQYGGAVPILANSIGAPLSD